MFRSMSAQPLPDSSSSPAAAIAGAVAEYRTGGDVPKLLSRLRTVTQSAPAAELAAAVEPFREIPEVAGPVYEVIVAQRPDDARALVILANAYWLAGRGPDVVGALASRAIAADATNRGAWHLWAITAEALRERVTRWQQVVRRFAQDDLARAALADNAASLASGEDDPVALKLAVDTYRALLARSTSTPQRLALGSAIAALTRESSR
jgi:hypothetical protein